MGKFHCQKEGIKLTMKMAFNRKKNPNVFHIKRQIYLMILTADHLVNLNCNLMEGNIFYQLILILTPLPILGYVQTSIFPT